VNRHHWWLQPTTLGAICGAGAILVYLASCIAEFGDKDADPWVDIPYHLGRLISLNEDPGDLASSITVVRTLRVAAEWLVVGSYGLLGFHLFRLVGGPAYEWLRTQWRRLLFWRPKVLVIGDGRAAQWLAQDIIAWQAWQGRPVMLTHLRVDRVSDALSHPVGALMVIHARAITVGALRRAGIGHAERIIIAGDGQSTNLETLAHCGEALRAAHAPAVRIHVRVDSPDCAEQLEHALQHAQRAPTVPVRIFSPDRQAAECAIDRWVDSFGGTAPRIRGVMSIGLGKTGAAFLDALAEHSLDPALITPVVVHDLHAERAWERMRSVFAPACARLAPTLVDGGTEANALEEQLALLLRATDGEVVVSVSVGNVDANLSIGLRIAAFVREHGTAGCRVTLFVRQPLLVDFGALLARHHAGAQREPAQVVVWGGLEESFGADWWAERAKLAHGR
jgi:hypothetical protein